MRCRPRLTSLRYSFLGRWWGLPPPPLPARRRRIVPLFFFFLFLLLILFSFRLRLTPSSSRSLLRLLLFFFFLFRLLIPRPPGAATPLRSHRSNGRLLLGRPPFGGFRLSCDICFEGLFLLTSGLVGVEDLPDQLTLHLCPGESSCRTRGHLQITIEDTYRFKLVELRLWLIRALVRSCLNCESLCHRSSSCHSRLTLARISVNRLKTVSSCSLSWYMGSLDVSCV